MKKILLSIIVSLFLVSVCNAGIIEGRREGGGSAAPNQFVEPNTDTSLGNWADEGSGTKSMTFGGTKTMTIQ